MITGFEKTNKIYGGRWEDGFKLFVNEGELRWIFLFGFLDDEDWYDEVKVKGSKKSRNKKEYIQ